MPVLIKCKKYGTGDSPVTSMKSRDSSDSCNIWHISCQMLPHTRRQRQHVRNGRQFVWTPLYDKCLESIKALVCRAPVLKPIDMNNPDPIWVICAGSKSGVSAIYGQGPEWQTCCPAGFMSKKFSSAQQNYRTHEHETIAILEALIKWEDKLLG